MPIIRPAVLPDDVIDRGVGILPGPITLPLQHDLLPRDRDGPGLDHACHRELVRFLAGATRGVGDDVDLITGLRGLDRRQDDADLRPEPRDDKLGAPSWRTTFRTRSSSQAFMVVRSIGFCSGKTAWISGNRGPLKVWAATVVRIVGTLNALAALARPTALLRISPRSWLCTPNAICGW